MGNIKTWSIEIIGLERKRNNYWHPGKKRKKKTRGKILISFFSEHFIQKAREHI